MVQNQNSPFASFFILVIITGGIPKRDNSLVTSLENFSNDGVQESALVVGKKSENNSKQESIYSPLGQGNTLLSFNGTYMSAMSDRMYIGTARRNTPINYLGTKYYGNGQTFLKQGGLIKAG
ncbi:MAG: hypothetical protein EOO85_13155, partial [Pedobacter sp.]